MNAKRAESNPVAPPSMLPSSPGDVRIGPVLAIPAVLAELGVRPHRAFARAGVDLRLFRDPECRVSFEALGRLFESCVTLTSCSHFGLLVGERFDLKGLGPIGYLMRNSATVEDALRSLLMHLYLHDKGAAPVLLVPTPSSVIFGYSIYQRGTPATAHIYDAAVAIGYKILRELCGPSWKPMRVQFSHGRPSSTAPYRRLFGARVDFDADVTGIVLSSAWMKRRIEGADAALHAVIASGIRNVEAQGPATLADRVQSVLPQLILSGTATATVVAHQFALPERTLRRRLNAEGKSLQQLINQTRYVLAQQLLQNTDLPVSGIAAALQYADPNAFSRAFGTWADLTPTEYRARARAPAPPTGRSVAGTGRRNA